MAGWIKMEKNLETDPRVLRMLKSLEGHFRLCHGAGSDACNAPALQGSALVTLVCGALTRLWIYADSHIRSDNTLDLGALEIDEWLGLPGFCNFMPPDWLIQVDQHTVELPRFQEHNGVEARKKALTQKRVARHRSNQSGGQKDLDIESCNAPALPDQTRPDLYQTREEREESAQKQKPEARASRLPTDFALTAERRRTAEEEGCNADRTFSKFTDHWLAASGANARKRDWDAAWRNWCRIEIDRKPNGSKPQAQRVTWRPEASDASE